MNVIFYLLPPEKIGLKFENSTQRDAFWRRLGETERNGITGQHAAELIGNRTIRFHAELIEEGFEWPLNGDVTSPVTLGVQPGSNAHQSPAQDEPALPAAPPEPQSVITSNPFGFAAHVTSKPLPGMVPAPPQEMLAPLETIPGFRVEAVAHPLPPPPAPPDDDPKPPGHHMSKAVRAWRERQAERLAKAQQKV